MADWGEPDLDDEAWAVPDPDDDPAVGSKRGAVDLTEEEEIPPWVLQEQAADGHRQGDDEPAPAKKLRAGPPVGEQETKKSADTCYKCGKAGHWARDCPEAAARAADGGAPADDLPPQPPKECPGGCGECAMLTSRSERNPNRRFYTCPKPREERCGFFEWFDPPPGGAADGGASQPAGAAATGGGGGGGNCFKCGQAGHWSRDCPNAGGGGGGGYAGGGGGGGATGGGGGGGNCFKCGQPGHWSRDCPNAGAGGGGYGAGGYGGGGSGYGGGGGGYGGRNNGGGGTSGGGGGGNCFKCGQPGHWASKCPQAGGGGGGGFRGGGGGFRGGGGGFGGRY